MSLRYGAIEAMSRAMFDSIYSDPDTVAEVTLDALCDYLTEHADEWKAASYETVADADPYVFGAAALAALARGDTRED